jgi:hypothetical protein
MSLQRVTMGHMSGLAKVVRGTTSMLKIPGVIHGTTAPLAPCGPERMAIPLPTHPSKAHSPQHP